MDSGKTKQATCQTEQRSTGPSEFPEDCRFSRKMAGIAALNAELRRGQHVESCKSLQTTCSRLQN